MWFLTRPRWLVGGVLGLLCAGLFVVFGLLNSYGLLPSVVVGVIGGALFGVAMVYLTRSSRQRLLSSAGSISSDRRLAAVRLALQRRTPSTDDDPRVVRGAQQVAHYRREENRRQQTATVLVLGILLALGTGMTLINSPYWLVTVGLFAILIVISLDRPRRLRHREEKLDAAVATLAPTRPKNPKQRRRG